MPIEFPCTQCSSQLRVPDEHVGKKVKCPKCSEVNTVPSARTAGMTQPGSTPPGPIAAPVQSNPYAAGNVAPSGGMPASSGAISVDAFKPLFDSVFFIKFLAWFLIVMGGLACLTIVGVLVAWLPIWIGICLKNTAEGLQNGYPRNDSAQLHRASSNLSTAIKIISILYMINAVFLLLYFAFFVIFIVIMGVGAAGAGSGF